MQQLCNVPRDRLPLTVRVGRQIDTIALFGVLLELLDDVLFALHIGVLRLEAVFHVHAELGLWQITNVPHGGDDIVILSQIFLNGFRLCRRLHND